MAANNMPYSNKHQLNPSKKGKQIISKTQSYINKPTIFSTQQLIAKLEKKQQEYIKKFNKKTIPFFKRIMEELKKISKKEDINHVIKTLEKIRERCGKNGITYSDIEVMPILSLFTSSINFLNYQKNNFIEKDFKLIHDYDLSKTPTTQEDKMSISEVSDSIDSSVEKMIVLDSEVSDNELTFANDQLFYVSELNSKKNILKSKVSNLPEFHNSSLINEKELQLKKLMQEKAVTNKKLNNCFLDFKISIQKANRWWHKILKFLTFGIWKSKKIQETNKKYFVEFGKLSKNINLLNVKIQSLQIEIKNIAINGWNNRENQNNLVTNINNAKTKELVSSPLPFIVRM